MELSFTQGRWNYESWGGFDPISSSNAKPPGVELWAVFDVPQHHIDASWKNLTHTLSGLFCASINFLQSTATYSTPEWSFPPASGNVRYGTLPCEAVCTENQTPWLKLLPCRDKAGIALLLDRPSLYRGFYHSQQLHLTSTGSSSEGIDSGIILEQTLTVVLQPNSEMAIEVHASEKHIQPSWSLSSIFGKQVSGICVLAKSSSVYLLLDRGLVAELKFPNKENGKSAANGLTSENFWSNPSFELSANPDRIFLEESSSHSKSLSILYMFQVEKYSESEPFDIGLMWKVPVAWLCQQTPLHASRFLMGSGNERAAIAISLKSTQFTEGFMSANSKDGSCELRVAVFQVVPWYVKVYFHSLRVFVDQQPRAVSDIIEKIHVSPSKDKMSPGVMEVVLKLPCRVNTAALTIEFDKGFLRIDEYTSDANQGFDIPSAIISFPNFHASMVFLEDDSLNKSPEKCPVMSYTEVLLVPLTTPDFSMPYNVITITCTVFALYFGSLLNVLQRRVAEEERFLKAKAAKKTGRLPLLLSKLSAKLRGRRLEPLHSPPSSSSFINSKLVLKVILVAGLAVGWQYFSS
ncbi:hypothetical protein Goari_013948 [Gossypium aridum]|uniref:GPI transamidase component PIG-T n=1 Tax=Gossypium aridum TaxID=34290 RepID=A0A7J8XGV9_GOSAI|nr:hypothetical protein [Gossypium aridum]